MRLQGRTFIPGFRVEENNDDEELDEQQVIVAPHINGGINGHQINRGDVADPGQTVATGERRAVNEPIEQTAVGGVRYRKFLIRQIFRDNQMSLILLDTLNNYVLIFTQNNKW